MSVPAASQPASANPITGVNGSSALTQKIKTPKLKETSTANQSRDIAAGKSPLFQANIGPIAISKTSGIITGTNVALKNGGPTDTF